MVSRLNWNENGQRRFTGFRLMSAVEAATGFRSGHPASILQVYCQCYCALICCYYYYTRLMASFGTTQVSQYQKGKTSLDLNEARSDEFLGCSGISWTICKQYVALTQFFLTPTQECQNTKGNISLCLSQRLKKNRIFWWIYVV